MEQMGTEEKCFILAHLGTEEKCFKMEQNALVPACVIFDIRIRNA